MNTKPVSLETNAGTSASNMFPFRLNRKLSHIANDSSLYDLKINFDASIDEAGSFTVKAGEVVTDIEMNCSAVSFQGIGGNVAFRLLGV